MEENFSTGKNTPTHLMTKNYLIFSINCVDWLLLQDPSEDSLTKSDVIRGRFIGDPSYEVILISFVQILAFSRSKIGGSIFFSTNMWTFNALEKVRMLMTKKQFLL